EILLHRLDRHALVRSLLVGELGLEALEPVAGQVERHPVRRLTPRVQRDQVARELLDRLARPALEQLPRLAAQLGQRRRLRVGADVARHLPDLLVRDVEPILAAEREEEVVAGDAGDLFRLEAEQASDPVILVDDEIASPQVGEGLERPAEARVRARRPLAEDLRVGKDDDAEVAPDEAASRGRDGEEEALLLRQLHALLEPLDREAAELARRSQAVSAVRERDDDALAAPD